VFEPGFFKDAIIYGPVILFSLTVHEYFHAWTAYRFGDSTAARAGRLTLNPLAHLDLVGTLVMVFSGFRFGWAKPVPVNPLNMRNPRVADIWVSAAGPLSNFGLAVAASLVFHLFHGPEVMQSLLIAAVVINVSLGLFNLLPLFPLDGSHILRNLIPHKHAASYDQFEQYAPWILLAVVATGIFWIVAGPIVNLFVAVLLGQ
jgi:Zn-dependent protease